MSQTGNSRGSRKTHAGNSPPSARCLAPSTSADDVDTSDRGSILSGIFGASTPPSNCCADRSRRRGDKAIDLSRTSRRNAAFASSVWFLILKQYPGRVTLRVACRRQEASSVDRFQVNLPWLYLLLLSRERLLASLIMRPRTCPSADGETLSSISAMTEPIALARPIGSRPSVSIPLRRPVIRREAQPAP